MRDRILWTFREEGGYIQLLARIAKSMINVTNSGLLLSASIGIIQLVRSKKRFSYLFLLYIIGNILIWGAYVRERFFLPLVPFLCIYAAEGLIVLLHNKKRRIKAAITLAIVALVSISLFQCLQGISLRLHDTRTEASKFIHAHIPSEASLGIAYISKKTPAPPHKTYYPPINETRFTTVDIANYPEYIVISSYDLTPIIEAFVNNTVTNKYTIKDEYLKNWPYYQAPSSNLLRFYANLLEGRTDYILLKRFSRRIDVPIEHHPPTIWVIKRDKERAQQFPKERFSYRSCFH